MGLYGQATMSLPEFGVGSGRDSGSDIVGTGAPYGSGVAMTLEIGLLVSGMGMSMGMASQVAAFTSRWAMTSQFAELTSGRGMTTEGTALWDMKSGRSALGSAVSRS